MKIAVYHDLPSGGAKRTLYESMKRLSKRHTLDVFTLETADKNFCDLREFTNAEQVFPFSPSTLYPTPFGRLNQFQRWKDLLKLDRLARRIASVIDAGDYDVVFAQPCMWTQAPLVLKYLATPALYYCHEPPRHMYENSLLTGVRRRRLRSVLNNMDPFIKLYQSTGQRFDRQATRAAKRVLVNSVFIRDQVRHIYGIDPVISYHGVDMEMYTAEAYQTDKRYVLSVGAIQPHKGFDFLIESFGQIDERVRPPLYLIGNMENPAEQSRLQALAKQNGVDLRIEVGVDQATLVQRYKEAAFIAYAPYNEPFGLVPLEAMACGKPVVGVDEGGVRETVVHNRTGLLVERDAYKFGKAVQSLLEDPALVSRYGANGRNYVIENWSWERAVDQLENHMQEIIF